jgi:hypothetical protein
MNCPDCTTIGKNGAVPCVFDAKQMGEVCVKCTRVFSVFNPNPNHFHYATEKGYRAKMLKDRLERRAESVSTTAMVDRILRPID